MKLLLDGLVAAPRRLEEEPRAVAFNPWGYQLLVALPQRVLVYYVLVNK